jgi:hypothetical protein
MCARILNAHHLICSVLRHSGTDLDIKPLEVEEDLIQNQFLVRYIINLDVRDGAIGVVAMDTIFVLFRQVINTVKANIYPQPGCGLNEQIFNFPLV